jgi:HEAT repeat protein
MWKRVALVGAAAGLLAVAYWAKRSSQSKSLTYEVLSETLPQMSTSKQIQVIEKLISQGPPSVPVFKRLVWRGRPEQQALVLMGIGRLGTCAAECLPEVRAMVRHQHVRVRQEAVVALGRIVPEQAPEISELAEALQDPDLTVREHAVRALAGAGSRSVPLLEKALAAPEVRIQVAALQTLCDVGPAGAEAVPEVQQLTSAGHPLVRFSAFCTLGKMGGPGADALGQLVASGRRREQKLGAAVGLVIAGPWAQKQAELLVPLLTGDDDNLAFLSALALARIGKPARNYLPAILRAARWDSQVEPVDPRVIGQGGYPVIETQWRITAGLASGDLYSAMSFFDVSRIYIFDRRAGALWALSLLGTGTPQEVAAFKEAFEAPSILVRRAAAVAASRLLGRTDELAAIVAKAVHDPDAAVRAWAEDSLAEFQKEKWAPRSSRTDTERER